MTTTTFETHSLELDDAAIAYDVYAAGSDSGRPTVLMIGQPMTAEGFRALADEVAADRTVVTYDPRGLGRSTRSDGSTTNDPHQQARDLHALIGHLGAPIDIFASSGGAVTGLALVAAFPDDVRVLVAHEPPVLGVLPDAELALDAARVAEREYAAKGFGAGLAAFIRYVSHEGEFPADYAEQPLPDPAQFGLPTEDDGSRDDALLGGSSRAFTEFMPDIDAVRAAPTRVVIAGGETSKAIVTGRASIVLAEQLGSEVAYLRGGHGGFAADEWGVPGDPARFANQLRAVLD